MRILLIDKPKELRTFLFEMAFIISEITIPIESAIRNLDFMFGLQCGCQNSYRPIFARSFDYKARFYEKKIVLQSEGTFAFRNLDLLLENRIIKKVLLDDLIKSYKYEVFEINALV